jgi:hypothetical protein
MSSRVVICRRRNDVRKSDQAKKVSINEREWTTEIKKAKLEQSKRCRSLASSSWGEMNTDTGKKAYGTKEHDILSGGSMNPRGAQTKETAKSLEDREHEMKRNEQIESEDPLFSIHTVRQQQG